MRQGHSNGGRRNLGPRHLVSSRIPATTYERLCAVAKERDITLNDFVAALIERELEAAERESASGYRQEAFFPQARSA